MRTYRKFLPMGLPLRPSLFKKAKKADTVNVPAKTQTFSHMMV